MTIDALTIDASPREWEDIGHSSLALLRWRRELPTLGADEQKESDNAAALAALLAFGTRVICRPMTLAPPLVANSCVGTSTQT